jgi:hypothetical protein
MDQPANNNSREVSLLSGLSVVFGTIFLGITVCVVITLAANFGSRQAAQSLRPWEQSAPESVIPTREETFGPQLDEMRKVEDDHLQNYGWVDLKLKVVRIPIDRATELLLKQEGGADAADEKKP